MPLTGQGSSAGGQTVVITGTNLGGATAVHFGSKLATPGSLPRRAPPPAARSSP
ncbi:IPT/TIG domain-containing protein [Stenotrophomonas sp. NPDC087984]